MENKTFLFNDKQYNVISDKDNQVCGKLNEPVGDSTEVAATPNGTDNQQLGEQQTADGTGEQQTADGTGEQQTTDGTGEQQTADGTDKQQTADGTGEQQHGGGRRKSRKPKKGGKRKTSKKAKKGSKKSKK